MAALNHENSSQEFPAGFTQEFISAGANSGYQGHSVFYYLLPYIEETALYESMDADIPKANRAASSADGKSAAVMAIYLCPSDGLPSAPIPWPSTGTPLEFYGGTSYRGNGGTRPIFATSSTNDGMFMAVGPNARKAPTAPDGAKIKVRGVKDGLSKTILFGEFSHYDPNFDSFTAAGFNSGSTIAGWSRWYPAAGDNGLGNLLAGAFAPGINYRIPWRHGAPGAPGSQGAWYTIQDQRLSAFGSTHPGGANISMADSSTRFTNEGISQNVLRLQCQRNDGFVIID